MNQNNKLEKYEEEIGNLRNVLKEKEKEIIFLNAYIIEKSRLLNLIRELVRVLDKSITFRLEKKIKRKRHYPSLQIDSTKDEKPEKLLQIINTADHLAYITKPDTRTRLKVLLAKLLLRLYRLIKKTSFKILRTGYRLIKPATNSNRGVNT